MNQQRIHEMFNQMAERFPTRIAIERGNKRLTYSELEESSNKLASFLLSQGTSRGSIIAILAEDPCEIIKAMIAVLKIGCAFVPLDPRSPEKRLQAMVAEVEPAWFLTESKFFKTMKQIANALGAAHRSICLDADGAHELDQDESSLTGDYLAFEETRRLDVPAEPDSLCYIYFTSGSTGRPKGIAGRLKAIDHFIKWETETFRIEAGTRVSQFVGPAFDAFLRDAFVPLSTGGTVCAPEDRDAILDGRKLVAWLDAQQINLIHCVPTLFRSIVNQELKPEYFSSLKHILMAGEPLLPVDVAKWMDVFGDRVQLVNLYGPTETTMTKFFYLVKPTDCGQRSIPIGKPMQGARALVIDEKGRVSPPGAVGEIYIRTPYRSLGYYKQPELTSEVFIQNPFSDNPTDLVYKTGDMGRMLEDGNFEFLGRKDSQVKVRGVRIELGEIEGLLLQHPSVSNVAVLDREDTAGDKYLCAYVVLNEKVEPGALRDFILQSLPDYMVPSAFVLMDELPLTISGKVDRKALPLPVEAHAARQRGFVAPRTPVEQSVADVWCQVLGIKRVSIHDNFFELGGHSLLATQLLSRVSTVFGVEAPLRVLFESPTIAKLSLALTQMQVEQENSEEMAQMIEEIRLLSADAVETDLNKEIQGTEIGEA